VHTHHPQRERLLRRGSLIPALAVAILAVGCCLALVLDKLWLDAARSELRIAVEAAALAAAGRLAEDERINPSAEPQWLADAARDAAVAAAGDNRVAGQPLLLDGEPGGQVQLGLVSLDPINGQPLFLESDAFPTSVRITAARARAIGNPVARLFGSLTGVAAGDAIAAAEAVISNAIVGVRPFEGGPVPALPLAIWERDPQNERTDTWDAAIEQGLGSDEFAFDFETRDVIAGSDGLPELTLHARASPGNPQTANVQLIDVGNELDDARLARQTRSGWTVGDLAGQDGELRLDGPPVSLSSSAVIADETAQALAGMVGQKRLALLYSTVSAQGGDRGQAALSRLVAVRIMQVDVDGSGAIRVVIQPTVLATRTALLGDPQDLIGLRDEDGNPYVYKLSLTR